MTKKPLYIVYAWSEEEFDDDEPYVFAVVKAPPHEITFESCWEQAKEAVREEFGIEYALSDILRWMTDNGWVFDPWDDIVTPRVTY